jgi:hypothetical protein
LIRQLCVGLAVTIMVTLQAAGVVNAGHRIEHALQFPDVSYADASVTVHDHGHHDDGDRDHAHDYETAATDQPTDDGELESASAGSTDRPLGHHHHGGGDVPITLSAPAHPVESALYASVNLGPGSQTVPPGADPDAPLDPPRQNA